MVYKIHLTHSKNEAAQTIELHNPADMPDPNRIESIEEPWIEATIYVPDEYLGAILKLCQDRRGIQKDLTYVGTGATPARMLTLRAAAQRSGVRFLRPAEVDQPRLCQLRLSSRSATARATSSR